jgi:hypothetical protein
MREPVRYSLMRAGVAHMLDGVQWADWDAGGRLLVATDSGSLEVRHRTADGFDVVFTENLAALSPDPQPAPVWAREW